MDNIDDREDSRTIWCGNLSEKVTEELLYELFLQAGPLEKVRIAKDRDGRQLPYAFITFKHQSSVKYVLCLFQGMCLYERDLNLKPRSLSHISDLPNISCDNLLQMGSQITLHSNSLSHNYNSSGHTEFYRGESLQGRWLNSSKNDRDLRPHYNYRRDFKRHRH